MNEQESIKNFVDNIHNEHYKDAYNSPLFEADNFFLAGGREEVSLDGMWNFSVDMYDNCLRAKWYLEETCNEEGRRIPLDYGFDDWEKITVPSVWNLAKLEYYYYEGTAVYCRRFTCRLVEEGHLYLRFGAVAYEARIFLNGVFLGLHKGGSTPFCVEVTQGVREENRLIVIVDNTRKKEQVPSENTDWFPYGGIYRSVSMMWVPDVFIKHVKVWLKDVRSKEIGIRMELSQYRGDKANGSAMVVIPELGVTVSLPVKDGTGEITVACPELQLWSPENPKLYQVEVCWQKDKVVESVGLRMVETKNGTIWLNSHPLFLRGVCVHEETELHGKAVTDEDIREIFIWAKRLGCNFLRLAHYPHTERVSKLADKAGLMLWEEIPIYWWMDFENPVTLSDAVNQLRELVYRDCNRASVILWSVGNENPDTDARYTFMKTLAKLVKELDHTRLVSAACLVDTVNLRIHDRLEEFLDVIGLNEYYGWYDPDYGKLKSILENSNPKKPVIITEFGADGAARMLEDGCVRGSEEEQASIYRNQIAMFRKIKYIQGLSPWILFDFRTPKRLGKYQKGYNIKGLVTADRKYEKRAFQVMQEYYEEKLELSAEETAAAMDFATNQILDHLEEFNDQFKKAYSEDSFYKPTLNVNWTTGFWTGQIWLAYEWCLQDEEKREKLRRAGEVQVDSFLDRINRKVEVDHHDMGFLYSPSCVAAYKLTGNGKGREAGIKAADQLIGRFQPIGEFIQAWGSMDQSDNYRFIIDCLLNLPLLYWASEETGDQKYRRIAEKHIHTAAANVIREDDSTWHTFFMNMENGVPDHGATCQGYRDGSAWARGQAWGIYGMALAYRYTGRAEYIDKFKRVTGYFLKHLPKDMVPYWDLEFCDGSDEPRDSSSASIAVCGMLEMAKYMEPEEGANYTHVAKKMMKSVVDFYAVKDKQESNGLVLHGTYSKKSPYNTCTPEGVDECNIWGDYFYMEALTRLSKDWNPYW